MESLSFILTARCWASWSERIKPNAEENVLPESSKEKTQTDLVKVQELIIYVFTTTKTWNPSHKKTYQSVCRHQVIVSSAPKLLNTIHEKSYMYAYIKCTSTHVEFQMVRMKQQCKTIEVLFIHLTYFSSLLYCCKNSLVTPELFISRSSG